MTTVPTSPFTFSWPDQILYSRELVLAILRRLPQKEVDAVRARLIKGIETQAGQNQALLFLLRQHVSLLEKIVLAIQTGKERASLVSAWQANAEKLATVTHATKTQWMQLLHYLQLIIFHYKEGDHASSMAALDLALNHVKGFTTTS